MDQLNHEAWYWLGEVFSSQGHKELAANCYRMALNLELTAPVQPFSVVPHLWFLLHCEMCGVMWYYRCYVWGHVGL